VKLIGINGGTFDPIHNGHLRPALEAMQQLNLTEVQFIPCKAPVHKDAANASSQQRIDMVGLAIQSQPKFVLNTLEIDKDGPSFTVETLEILKQKYPDDALVLMMGTDNFVKFHTWHRWQDIIKLANIAILHRPGESVPLDCTSGTIYQSHKVTEFTQPAGQMLDIEVTQLDISSTRIRNLLEQGKSVEYLIRPCVLEYINNHKLYQKREENV
jgi:nicotinate-nucleotide adenylyltransferase